MFTDLFGKYPFPTDNKKPLAIKKEMTIPYIAPPDNIYKSDINHLFFSTGHLTVGMFELAPGSCYDSADIHEGDECYYVLQGTLTVHNPQTGECACIKPSDSMLVPMYGYHKGYNFGQDVMRVLFAIAPKVPAGNKKIIDYAKEPMRMFKSGIPMPELSGLSEWNVHPTIDCLGQWPVAGKQARKAPVLLYSIPDHKKLISVYGAQHPMLVKFFVSNDLFHMGEFYLPSGSESCRASEPLTHGSDCGLYIKQGPVAVYLIQSGETFLMEDGEVMFLPANTEYQLLNYTDHGVHMIFSIGDTL